MINEFRIEGSIVEMAVSDKQVLFDLDDFPKLNRFNQWKLSRGKSVVTDYRDKEKMLRITLHRLITGSKFVKWLNGNIFDFRKENIMPIEKSIRPRPCGIFLKGNEYRIEKGIVVVLIESKGNTYETYADYEDYPVISKHTWNRNPVSGYAQAKVRLGRAINKGITMHRLIMGVTDPDISIDHINGNQLDNRKCNLRICSMSQNDHNKEIHRNGTAGVSKVSHSSWEAHMKTGSIIRRKRFKTYEEALAQRKAWEKEFNPSGLQTESQTTS